MGWKKVRQSAHSISEYREIQSARRQSGEPRAFWIAESQRRNLLAQEGTTVKSMEIELARLEQIRNRRKQIEDKVIQAGM